MCTNLMEGIERSDLHEWVVDRNHKDLTGILDLGMVDIAWDMRFGACWA
jgi:hypothetical protein